MKKIILSLFMLAILGMSANAQINVYHPFPDSNAIWSELNTWTNSYGYEQNEHYQFGIFGDTIINTLVYHKLYIENNCLPDTIMTISNSSLIGAIREDSLKKIYFYNINDNAVPVDSIYKLYDFSLNVGDTVTFNNHIYSFLVVDSIGSVLVNNQYRKQYYFSQFGESWVEGIGSIRSLLSTITPYLTCFCIYEMICYKHNDTTYYVNPNYNNCYPLYSIDYIKNFTSNVNRINVYPNPATDNLTIESPQPATIEITNIEGQVIEQQTTNVETTNFVVSALARGMYFVKVKTEKGVAVKKFVKE